MFYKTSNWLLILFFFVVPVAAQSSLWGNLKAGQYRVGLNVRSYRDSNNRPIEIFLWFPAENSKKSKPLTFADYYRLSEKVTDESRLTQTLAEDVTGDKNGIDKQTAGKILNSAMKASWNAPISRGRFPLILWSSRHATVIAQSVLSEFLASHGYVVAFARYAGPALPYPFQIREPEKKLEALDTHVRDLEFALANLRRAATLDAEKIALISWSYGGEAAIRLQTRQPDIDLVFGLSSIRFDRGPYQGRLTLDLQKLNVPYI